MNQVDKMLMTTMTMTMTLTMKMKMMMTMMMMMMMMTMMMMMMTIMMKKCKKKTIEHKRNTINLMNSLHHPGKIFAPIHPKSNLLTRNSPPSPLAEVVRYLAPGRLFGGPVAIRDLRSWPEGEPGKKTQENTQKNTGNIFLASGKTKRKTQQKANTQEGELLGKSWLGTQETLESLSKTRSPSEQCPGLGKILVKPRKLRRLVRYENGLGLTKWLAFCGCNPLSMVVSSPG